jgi:DNA-binding transcriptional ArsR family regulator
MNQQEAQARARILKALAHPVRLTIVDELRRGDRCACELLPLVAIDQSVLSRHLAILKNTGIVSERREGQRAIQHLACTCIVDALDCTIGVLRAEARRATKLAGNAGK